MENNKNEPEEEVAEGQIIDVEPEADTTESAADTQGPQQTSSAAGKFPLPLILAIIAIVAVSITWLAGYRYWQNMLADLNGMEQRIAATLDEQEKLNSEIKKAKLTLQEQKQAIQQQTEESQKQAEQIANERQAITNKADAMQLAVEQVNLKIGRTQGQWHIAEAEYLMRIANHRLSLSKDIQTAIAALQQADQKLLDSGDPAFYSVREKLADEISQLRTLQPPDIAGIAATLQSLAANVNQLTIAGLAEAKSPGRPSIENETSERNLDTLIDDSWKGFKELMVIRRHDQPVSAMLPPSQQYFLYQNLQLQLESARLALLRQENILFNSSLETAIEWLDSFFDVNDAATQNMLQTLQGIQATNLNPAYPDISGSLGLLLQLKAGQS